MRRHLFVAAESGDDEAILMLLERGVLVDKRDKRGKTALMHAAAQGRLSTLRLLLDRGADPNAADEHRVTPLMAAARAAHAADNCYRQAIGPPEAVELLLQRGASVQAQDTDGRTALFYAGPETAALLLEAGADVDARDHQGATPLLSERWFVEVAQVLLDHGADVRARDHREETALLYRLRYYNLNDAPEKSLAHVHELKTLDDEQLDPHGALVLLLRRGVELNARGERGETALIRAARYGLDEQAWLLMKYGADLEVRDERGRTALMGAGWAITRLLLDQGADLQARDPEGKTALDLALEEDDPVKAGLLRTAADQQG
jgi:ankyrin repeat protein